MNAMVGDPGDLLRWGVNINNPTYQQFLTESDLRDPSKIFVFLDEHPDSINDAAFATQSDGAYNKGSARIIDFPASYHNGACGFSFCDGHSEIHKWIGSKIKAPVHYNNNLQLNTSADDSWVDVSWMAQNATLHR